jgi:transcriptional regulator with PAS, ATPase and Fis domain
VFSATECRCEPIPLENGSLAIGRGSVGRAVVDDDCLSRKHAEVSFGSGGWTVRDLDSRNGTALDAQPVRGEVKTSDGRVLRAGDSVFLLLRDLRPFQTSKVEVREGTVVGPRLRERFTEIDAVAASGDTLHIVGETGSGKERAAQRFHASGPNATGPFVPVNCAAIPQAIAERLLFGAKRGAYSGADNDAEGYVQAADGGVLFLDEIAELDLGVQAKLLRTLESREVVPLGAARPRKVNVRICTATHADLGARVAEGRFREDLHFRIGRPAVTLPAIRERAEEIPWLIAAALEKLRAHVSFVELALTREWPGNVRELLLEVREAARVAGTERSAAVEARHLAPNAGTRTKRISVTAPAAPAPEPERRAPPTKHEIEGALRTQQGNVARAARSLGVHRTQLRRWLEREAIDPKAFGPADAQAESDDADD